MTMHNLRDRLRSLGRYYLEAEPGQRRRMALLAVFVLLLLGTSCIWVYYLRTRKPLPAALPPVPVVARVFKPHYLFSIYKVDRPIGVAVTPEGDRIYVTESDGDRLIKAFDREGNFLFAFAPPDSNPLERAPVYVTVAPDGQVYVSDRRRHAVYVYDSQGNYERTLDAPTGEDFWAPLGLTIVGGNLYITDVTKGEHRVLVCDLRGQLQRALGKEGQEPGQFWFPNAVEVDAGGRIYVSDSNNGRLQVFDAQGQLLYTLGGFSLPRGMAIDEEGRLFVVEAVGQRVRVYGLDRQPPDLLHEFGDLGIGEGEFNYPNDIAVDQTARLYITDRENNRVQVWSY